ncbi:MAG: phytoene desaturase family protein [Opitutales bacterium]
MPIATSDHALPSSTDVLIIGAGLAGLAAAARLAMFGKKVVLLEKHYVVGGLNSFYARKGNKFDVGLHALTNYPSPNSGKKSPLLKLLRQLRLSLDDLDLLPQSRSRITFGDCSLSFHNEFEYFHDQVAEIFPSSMSAFSNLLRKMEDFPAYQVDAPDLSTRTILADSQIDPLLAEMLLCPTCYYGSALPNDIDFATFVMLFDAIFRQGLCRPKFGIRAILDPLVKKLKELGVDRRMNCAVQSIQSTEDEVTEVLLENGERIQAQQIISTCGVIETAELLNQTAIEPDKARTGEFSVIESIRVFTGHPKDFGWDETIVFFNESNKFDYNCPDGLVDLRSGVICMPDNYGPADESQDSKIRVTHPANFSKWSVLSENEYSDQKSYWESTLLENAMQYLPNGHEISGKLNEQTTLVDTFTPKTIKRFTSHVNGTLYGSPTKRRDGSTKFKNLYLAGTDQGYVGIVGAMLGGIAVANNQILRES